MMRSVPPLDEVLLRALRFFGVCVITFVALIDDSRPAAHAIMARRGCLCSVSNT